MKTVLETANTGIEFLLKIALLSVVIYAVAFPENIVSRVRGALETAGLDVTKLTLWGVELRLSAGEATTMQARLDQQRVELDEVKRSNADMLDLMACLNDQSCDQDQTARIAELVGAGEAQLAGIEALGSTLDSAAIQISAAAVAEVEAGPPPPVAASTPWVIVVGADRSLDEAEVEATRLSRGGYTADIVRRGSYFRTIAEFTSQAAAAQAKPAVQSLMGRPVFVLEMAAWCPTPSQSDGMRVCQTN
ncbi:MAG: hypothetical protein AAFR17_09330 [Pseudomonadota bacterium]